MPFDLTIQNASVVCFFSGSHVLSVDYFSQLRVDKTYDILGHCGRCNGFCWEVAASNEGFISSCVVL